MGVFRREEELRPNLEANYCLSPPVWTDKLFFLLITFPFTRPLHAINTMIFWQLSYELRWLLFRKQCRQLNGLFLIRQRFATEKKCDRDTESKKSVSLFLMKPTEFNWPSTIFSLIILLFLFFFWLLLRFFAHWICYLNWNSSSMRRVPSWSCLSMISCPL